jgi:hypothetical protein
MRASQSGGRWVFQPQAELVQRPPRASDQERDQLLDQGQLVRGDQPSALVAATIVGARATCYLSFDGTARRARRCTRARSPGVAALEALA